METLWAPWRSSYVTKAPASACLFCETTIGKEDEKDLVLYRGTTILILMNLYPYNPGHVMIAPYRHVGDLGMLSADEQLELIREAARSTRLLRKVMHPDGFNLGMNQGKIAGAGIEDHLHLHIVPRWNGDTNFMPVVAGTKVIPEDLASTYQRLVSLFREN